MWTLLFLRVEPRERERESDRELSIRLSCFLDLDSRAEASGRREWWRQQVRDLHRTTKTHHSIGSATRRRILVAQFVLCYSIKNRHTVKQQL